MRRLLVLVVLIAAVAACSSQVAVLEVSDRPLVYVPMGNSIAFPMRDLYSDMLAEDFDVEIDVRDQTRGGQHAASFLSRLQNDESLREDLVAADVITFLVPNQEWETPSKTFSGSGGLDPADCGGDDGQQCLRDMIEEYNGLVDEIFAELMTIVDPSRQVIMVQDFYQFRTDRQTQATRLISSHWHRAQVHVQETAEAYGIAIARVWDDFMGTSGEIPDLIDAGLVHADGIHPSPAGAQRIADLFHDLGYQLET